MLAITADRVASRQGQQPNNFSRQGNDTYRLLPSRFGIWRRPPKILRFYFQTITAILPSQRRHLPPPPFSPFSYHLPCDSSSFCRCAASTGLFFPLSPARNPPFAFLTLGL